MTHEPARAKAKSKAGPGSDAGATTALVPLPTSREDLLELHRAARARRNAAPLGSEEYRAAAEEIGRIEVAIAALIPAGPLPSV